MHDPLIIKEIQHGVLEILYRVRSLTRLYIALGLGFLVGTVFLSQGLIFPGLGSYFFALVWVLLYYGLNQQILAHRTIIDTHKGIVTGINEYFIKRETKHINLEDTQSIEINTDTDRVHFNLLDGTQHLLWNWSIAPYDSERFNFINLQLHYIEYLQAWFTLNAINMDIIKTIPVIQKYREDQQLYQIQDLEELTQNSVHTSSNQVSLQKEPTILPPPAEDLTNHTRIYRTSQGGQHGFDVDIQEENDHFTIATKPNLAIQILCGLIALIIIFAFFDKGNSSLRAWLDNLPLLIFIIPLTLIATQRPTLITFDPSSREVSIIERSLGLSKTKTYHLGKPLKFVISPYTSVVELVVSTGKHIRLYTFPKTKKTYSKPVWIRENQPGTRYHSFEIKQEVIDRVKHLQIWLSDRGIEADIEILADDITTITPQ